MKAGDIILTKNRWCPMTWFLCYMLRCNYSHVSLAIDNKRIVELTPWGKKISPLNKYTNNKFIDVKILRLRNCNSKLLRVVVDESTYEMPVYSYWSFLKAIWHVYKGRGLERETCSGFVGYSLYLIGVNIVNTKYPRYITPRDFEQSNKLEEV